MHASTTRLWLLAIVALAIAVAVLAGRATESPVSDGGEAPAVAEAPIETVRGELERETLVEQPRRAAPEPAATPPETFGVVELRAVDVETGTGVRGFSWSNALETPGLAPHGRTAGFSSRLRVPIGSPAAVHVAADGYARSLAVDVSLRDGASHGTAVAHLVPAAEEPGIALRVVDDRGVPITDVRVSCETPVPGERNAWQLRWTETSRSLAGVHRFASGDSGRHRMRVVALEPSGRPRMLLPVTRTVTHDGTSDTVEDVVVGEPGGSIVLDAPVDPAPTARVLDAHGRALPIKWIARDEADRELHEAIPPGAYVVDLTGETWHAQRPVRVFAGQRTVCRMH